MSVAKKAPNQPWWEDLVATNLTGVKAVGANYYNVVPEEQAAAFDAMQAYTREKVCLLCRTISQPTQKQGSNVKDAACVSVSATLSVTEVIK